MNPVKQVLSNTQFPEALKGITATFFCKFSTIENTPLYRDALNLTQERIQ
jgi:hypothetical protein